MNLSAQAKPMRRKTFGYAHVLRPVGRAQDGNIIYLCWCVYEQCGNLFCATGTHLREGNIRSCGCLRRLSGRRAAKIAIEKNRIHGHKTRKGGSPTYNSWVAALQRCRNKKNRSYRNYGAKGVRVCKRWETFSNFLKDMGPRPDGCTLGRKLDKGNYGPGLGVRWMTLEEQAETRRAARSARAGEQ